MNKFQREDKSYDLHPKFKLFPEQRDAVDFILSKFNCIVGLQAGLGKSSVSITASLHVMRQSSSAVALILCPKSANSAWTKEFHGFGLKYSICTTEEKAFVKGSRFYLFNYSNVDNAIKFLYKAKEANLKVLGILDEAHQLSSEKSQLATKVRAVRGLFAAVVALTATPLLNDIEGTFRLVDLIRPGYLGNLYQFRDRYLVRKERIQRVGKGRSRKVYEIVGYKNLEELKTRLDKLAIVRRLKYNLNFIYRECEMDEFEKSQYNRASAGMIDPDDTSVKEFSARLHDLQRVADGTYDEFPKDRMYTKIKLLLQCIKEIVDRGEGCLVYTEYESTYGTLSYWIKKYQSQLGVRNIYLITGKVPQEQRVAVEKGLSPKDVVVITRAGVQSINLQAVNNVVFYNTPFAVGWMIQGIGRVARMDTKYPEQNIYILEAKDTIDTYKRILVESHAQLIEAIFGKETNLPDLRSVEAADLAALKMQFKRRFLWNRRK